MVSVIIPVYNVAQYLPECIESVIAQTYKDIEIILVDDGSTDNSGIICDEYAKKDNRIKVVHKPNGGLSSARNAGIDICSGEYITFIDSDDYIADDMIEQLYIALYKTESDISVCNFQSKLPLDEDNDFKVKTYSSMQALKEILLERKFCTSAWAKLYKTKLFSTVRYPEGLIYEDYATTYKLFDIASGIAHINTAKYYYRYNPESITKANFKNNQLDYFTVSDKLISFLENKYPEYRKYAVAHAVRNSIAFMRKISACGFDDEKIIDFLVNKIKPHIFVYCFSRYSIFSKMYGILICISPKCALKLFKPKK